MNNFANAKLYRFNNLMAEIDQLYHKAALKFGLSDSAMRIIYTLYSEGKYSCRLSEVCRMSGLSKQTANSAVRKLEADGIVVLVAEDGKQKSAVLTENGKLLAEQTVSKIIAAENRILEQWSELECGEYLRLTQDYMVKFKQEIESF